MAKAPAKQEAEEEEGAAPAPKPKKGKLPIIIGIVVVLVAVGVGAGLFFGRHGGDQEGEAAKPKKEEPPVYVMLETFTVNLQSDGASDQFLQTNISLQVADEKVGEAIKLRMPAIRNRLLMLLSSKKAAELATIEGKEKLGNEIQIETTRIVAPEALPEAVAAKPEAAKPVAAKAADEEAKHSDEDAKPAEDEAKADGSSGGDDEEESKPKKKAKKKKKPEAPAVESPIKGVLFTSFIIQ